MAEVTKNTLFKPTLSRTESKSRTTDQVARQLIDDEAARRDRKTERLRAARLAREAELSERARHETPKKKKAGAKTARAKKK